LLQQGIFDAPQVDPSARISLDLCLILTPLKESRSSIAL
jgi:hypothetical protein